ncbi:transmembrane protein 276 [Mantella aurantiaca]
MHEYPAMAYFMGMSYLRVHRGASAGFLLHSAASAIAVGCDLLWEELEDPGSLRSSSLWVAGIISLPLLVFSFFWLNGDHSTANLVLGSALLLAISSGYLTQESKMVATYFSKAGATMAILMVSLCTGNSYGVLGSLALAAASLLSSLNAADIPPFPAEMIRNCVYGTSLLALHMALRTQISDES